MNIIKHISVWGFNYFITHDPVEDTYGVQCSFLAKLFRKGYVKAMQEVISFSQQEEKNINPAPKTLVIHVPLKNKLEDVRKVAWGDGSFLAPKGAFLRFCEDVVERGEEIFHMDKNLVVTNKYYYIFFEVVVEEEHF